MAWWAIRNRDKVMDWAGFGASALPRLLGPDRGDVVTEARLRAALATDPIVKRTRDLQVSVRDGVAELRGPVDAEVALAATRVAERTPGVRSVRDATAVRSRRWRAVDTRP